MIPFSAVLQKFSDTDEKNGRTTPGRATHGWTYIDIPIAVTTTLRPGQKTSFRVRGTLDQYGIERVALGDGRFIMAVNADMRRGIQKEVGASVQVAIEVDDSPMPQSTDLLACLEEDPQAQAFFNQLSKGHQTYFCNWIEEAKTIETKTSRLTKTVKGLSMGMGFGEMIRYFKKQPE